jgi:hypothetical protein
MDGWLTPSVFLQDLTRLSLFMEGRDENYRRRFTRAPTNHCRANRTGELVEKELQHEGNEVREFYSTLPPPVLVGIEALCEGVRRNHHGLTDRRHVWWTAPQR